MLLGLLTATLPGGLAAAAQPDGGADRGAVVKPYGDRSDAELTALAADWDALDRHQRRALLTEMKLRMARQGEGKGVIHIRTERRYGRLIRQPDGRVIRIETQVVHVRPLGPDELSPAAARRPRHGFGVGFERRVEGRGEEAPAAAGGGVPGHTIPAPSIGEMLEGLEAEPLRQPPLPIYQVSDPAP